MDTRLSTVKNTSPVLTGGQVSTQESKLAAVEGVEPTQSFKSVLNKQVKAQQGTVKTQPGNGGSHLDAKRAQEDANQEAVIDGVVAERLQLAEADKKIRLKATPAHEDAFSKAELTDKTEQDHQNALSEIFAMTAFSAPVEAQTANVATSVKPTVESAVDNAMLINPNVATLSVMPTVPLRSAEANLVTGNAPAMSQLQSLTNNGAQLVASDPAVGTEKLALNEAATLGADSGLGQAHTAFATKLDEAQWSATQTSELKAEQGAQSAALLKDTNAAPLSGTLNSAITANTNALNEINASQALVSRGTIEAYPGKTGWDQAISQRVLWMVGSGEQAATLTLNPPDLGPLQVVVSVSNGQADASFTSDNAEVRRALQDGIEHLREKMRESGVELGQTNVQSGEQSRQTFEQATQNRATGQRHSERFASQNASATQSASQVQYKVSNGLVDTFA